MTRLIRTTLGLVRRRPGECAALAGALAAWACVSSPASAQIAFPPAGSRAFIQLYEIDSGGSVCPAGLCTIVSSPSTPLDLAPSHFTQNNNLTFIDAQGSIDADAMHALITSNVGTEYDLAMDDTYTVHGTATGSFPVTVSFEASGVANSFGAGPFNVVLAAFDMRIGQYQIDPNVTPIPIVSPFDSTTRVNKFFSVVQSTPFSVPVDFTISYTRMVSVGDVFDVGYELSPSPVEGQFDLSHTATISWNLPKGVFLTSALGGKFGTSGVPEPGTWAMLLAGLGALGASARRHRAAVAPPPRPAA
jgi:hypothetical protein